MDGALQSALVLFASLEHPPEAPLLPFELSLLRVIHACGMVDAIDDLHFSPGAGRRRVICRGARLKRRLAREEFHQLFWELLK